MSKPAATNPGPASAGGAREALLSAAREELAVAGPSAISLRAIARRAGVSHAAPKYHFGDRAGLLTALAVDGFRRLLTALEHAASTPSDTPDQLFALGLAYVDTGLADPALFELMFRPELLHSDDPDLCEAQQATFAVLASAVAYADGADGADPQADTDTAGALPLISWAFVHGLVVLARDGALQAATATATTTGGNDTALLLRRLTEVFANRLRHPAGHATSRRPIPQSDGDC